MYTRFLRDPGSAGGGGLQGLVEGLTELQDETITETPEQIAAKATETAAAEQTALKAEALETDGSLKPGYLKGADGTISKDATYVAPDPVPEEGLDEAGNLLPGYKKDEAGKVIVDPDYAADTLTEEEEAVAFFERVNAITGDDLEIEYPEGVKPLSPEGIAHYTQVIREDAALAFEQYLQQKDPRAYAYFLHRAAGLPDEQFHNDSNGFVLPTPEEFAASADMQSAVLKYNLKVQGLDDESIEVLVKKAITDNKLKEKADAAYKFIDDNQQKQLENITKLNADKEQLAETAIAGFIGKVDKAINSELKFVVSDVDKPAFRKFVVDNLRYDENTNTFSTVQKIDDTQLTTVIEALFFQHKKGNLNALVQKQAKTIAAQGLRLKLNAAAGGPGSGKSSQKADENFIPLSAMTVTQ